ncbi:MAG: tetratricopeptide repeat-containing sensor histidine kinase [Ferruginibacter sp.]
MRIFYFTLLLFCSNNGNAQLKGKLKLDSLLKAFSATPEDTSKVKLFHQIANMYSNRNVDSSIYYCTNGLALAENLNYKKGMEALYRVMGIAYKNKAQFDTAVSMYEKSLNLNREIGNKEGECSALHNLGSLQLSLTNDVKALGYLMEGLAIAEGTKNYYMLASLNNSLYSLYFNQQDFKKARQYSLKGLEFSKKADKPDVTAGSLRDLGCAELELGDTAAARRYFNEALTIYDATGNQIGQAVIHSYLSVTESNLRNAIEQGLQAKLLWDSLSPMHSIAINNLGNLGGAYLDIVRYDTLHHIKPGGAIPASRDELLALAENYLHTAMMLTGESNEKYMYYHFSAMYADLQEIKGNYKTALQYLRISTKIQDSMYSQENKNKISALISEKEISLRDKEIELNKLSIAANNRQRLALLGGLGLLAIIGGLIYWQSLTRKRTNTTLLKLNTELDDANKLKAKFFAILSHDFRGPVANLVSFLEMQEHEPGMLSAEQKSEHQKKISHSASALLETMESMLLWSKGQMENFRPEIKQVAVRELFDHIESFFSSIENVNLKIEDPGDMMVSTDVNYLQTIMHNLTSNAIKILRDKPGAVVSWKAAQQGTETVLSISDNGPGLSTEQSKAILSDVMMQNEKTGFGFHMIRDLAKAIRCKISLETNPGSGTIFRLSI